MSNFDFYQELMAESSVCGEVNSLVNARLSFSTGVFTPDECKLIVDDFARFPCSKGLVGLGKNNNEYQEASYLRDCFVTYCRKDEHNSWFLNRVESLIAKANSELWNLDVVDYSQPPRMMTYHAGNHFTSMHSDHGPNLTCFRKLTAIVQLSESDGYEGGDFELAGEPMSDKFREQGSVIIFPAYLFHRVQHVHSGTRHSLVHRAIGPPLR